MPHVALGFRGRDVGDHRSTPSCRSRPRQRLSETQSRLKDFLNAAKSSTPLDCGRIYPGFSVKFVSSRYSYEELLEREFLESVLQ